MQQLRLGPNCRLAGRVSHGSRPREFQLKVNDMVASSHRCGCLLLLGLAAAAPPTPPAQLSGQFTAEYQIASPNPEPYPIHYYYKGKTWVDNVAGKQRQAGTDYESPPYPFDSDFVQLCSASPPMQYFVENKTACTPATPKSCPVQAPSAIPAGATFVGVEKVNGLNTQHWNYYDPAYQSAVEAWTSVPATGELPALIRFVGDRVQTDYKNLTVGAPPSDVFDVPSACNKMY